MLIAWYVQININNNNAYCMFLGLFLIVNIQLVVERIQRVYLRQQTNISI